MSERYPGYDVLAKRHSPSWNEQTRQVIDRRLAIGAGHTPLLLRRRMAHCLRGVRSGDSAIALQTRPRTRCSSAR